MTAKTYPRWIFDGSEIADPPLFEVHATGEMIGGGERAVRFLKALKHPKSRLPKQAFSLDPWQERIVRAIYGPRHPNGDRIVKTVVLLLPRGNRKTSLAAALGLLHCIGPERVPGGEAIFAASDRTQAGIGFREARDIVLADKRLVAATSVYDAHNSAKKIVLDRDGAFLEIVSSDGRAQHGRTPGFVLADEIHVWRGNELYEALTTGLEKTDNGLLVVASTAGRGQENTAWRVVEDARKVARGEVVDPSILPVLFETDRDADWTDEALWHEVNPGLAHGYPSLDGMRRHAQRAARSPIERESFRQLKLNTWLDHSATPFVDMSIFDEGAAPLDLEALKGQACWIAVDASVTTDLTAIVAAFRDPEDDEAFIIQSFFFCPANNLRARGDRDKVPYPAWAEEGFLTPTPGDVIDYRAVEAKIRELCEIYDVREIAFDRAYAMPIMSPLMDDGFPVFTMPLDPKSQNAGVALLERAIGARKLRHGGHPVLRWCVGNVSIYTGHSGLRTMSKGRSTDRIDGAFAAWMAVSRAAANDVVKSIYTSDSWSDDLGYC